MAIFCGLLEQRDHPDGVDDNGGDHEADVEVAIGHVFVAAIFGPLHPLQPRFDRNTGDYKPSNQHPISIK